VAGLQGGPALEGGWVGRASTNAGAQRAWAEPRLGLHGGERREDARGAEARRREKVRGSGDLQGMGARPEMEAEIEAVSERSERREQQQHEARRR
jgi:hypothetical protein